MKRTFYQVLGVPEAATQEAIDAAYHQMQAAFQSRQDQGDQGAAQDLFNLKAAYEVLSNQEKRNRYDGQLARMRLQDVQETSQKSQQPVAKSLRLMKCDACGHDVSISAVSCPQCGERLTHSEEMEYMPMILGLLGAFCLLLGTFLPLVSAPIIGSMNYFMNGKGDGVIILLLALGAIAAVLYERLGALIYIAGASFVVMIITFVRLEIKLAEISREASERLSDNPFKGLAEAAVQTIQLQYGWAVLLMGVGLLTASTLMDNRLKAR